MKNSQNNNNNNNNNKKKKKKKKKKTKKIHRYYIFTRKLDTKLWDVEVRVMLIVVGALSTVYEGSERRREKFEIEERVGYWVKS